MGASHRRAAGPRSLGLSASGSGLRLRRLAGEGRAVRSSGSDRATSLPWPWPVSSVDATILAHVLWGPPSLLSTSVAQAQGASFFFSFALPAAWLFPGSCSPPAG